ncbi:MAG: single-stranded DNA-binding protein [Halanaerobiaceae bacterium]|nr:single-stranded DNA-binding protein [Halanaerobiaceae bacterium]
MLNHIILIGRLTRDPEMRYTSNGTAVTNFTLAVERNYTNQQGERDVDFINIVTWRKLAENCAQHLGKGRLVAVDGSLHIRKSESNGRTYINPEVVANDVRFLDWPSDNSNKDNNYDYRNEGHEENNNYDNDDFGNLDLGDDFDVPF